MMVEIRDGDNFFRLIPKSKNSSAPDWIFSELHLRADGLEKKISLEIHFDEYLNLRNSFTSLYQNPYDKFSILNKDGSYTISIVGDGARGFEVDIEVFVNTSTTTKLQYRLIIYSDLDRIVNQLNEVVKGFA